MAQDCMALFEKAKLSDLASVEQVMSHFRNKLELLLIITLVLHNRVNGGRQNTQGPCRGNGPTFG
jgi:hypothetical protein